MTEKAKKQTAKKTAGKKKTAEKTECFPAYIVAALSMLLPPEKMTVSEWAERNRVLDVRSAALIGAWRNRVTPYLVEIMDTLCDPDIEETIFLKPTQVGGTEAILNMLGYAADIDPAPAMIVYPTVELGESTSENRIIPMIRNAKGLRKRYRERASQKAELQFDAMYVTISGANSASSLASRPVRYLFLDEVDKYPGATKKEADPIRLARERTKTFVNRKIYMCSTPTTRAGNIWKAYEAADAEKRYRVPCPHCGEKIELIFKQIKFPSDEGMSDDERAELAVYVCQKCGGVIADADKPGMLSGGEWVTVRQKGKIVRKVAYRMSTLYSPFVRFSEIALEFLRSKDDPDALHNFTNSWLGEPWEETKTTADAHLLLERQNVGVPRGVVPEWAKLITAGVDVQEDCLYWSIRAWGDLMTSQNIAHGRALSFDEVTAVMNDIYRTESGREMMVELALIDSGDQTDMVYDFAYANAEWCLPCKGVGNMLSHYRFSTVNRAGRAVDGMTLVTVDGGKYKDSIFARMKKENGVGAWMVYDGCDEDYARQVTAEHKVISKTAHGDTLVWQKKSSSADNHYLDCEVYAAAAADIKGVRALHLEGEAGKAAAKQEAETAKAAEPETSEEQWIRKNEGWI